METEPRGHCERMCRRRRPRLQGGNILSTDHGHRNSRKRRAQLDEALAAAPTAQALQGCLPPPRAVTPAIGRDNRPEVGPRQSPTCGRAQLSARFHQAVRNLPQAGPGWTRVSRWAFNPGEAGASWTACGGCLGPATPFLEQSPPCCSRVPRGAAVADATVA